ncbi:MAG: response regulator transcription factor [Cyanobacteria bacterium SZAS-4]|nr:response regulator transcription factor [Cyanobacteria bacterium SZAS-4]
MPKTLLVDDDVNLTKVLIDWLKHEHHTVDCAHTVKDGRNFLTSFSYDLVILDWSLPDGSGVDLCTQQRKEGLLTPVLILTGKDQIDDKITGLDSGADDYLTKPFDFRELSARLRTLLRRSALVGENIITVGPLKLDILAHEIKMSDELLKLAPIDYSLLEFFMRSPGKVFTTDELLNGVWNSEEGAGAESVRSAVKRLRKIIGDNDSISLDNVFGVGYKLRCASAEK